MPDTKTIEVEDPHALPASAIEADRNPAAAELEAREEPRARESEVRASQQATANEPAATPPNLKSAPEQRRRRALPFIVTAIAVAIAGVLGTAMWNGYMGAPWTRDGTVRAYVVTMAPEVAGRIVDLPVRDNQFVHKGDLLMVIDPTNFKIAVSLNEATVQQAQANMWNTARESQRRQALSNLAVTTEEKETFASNAVSTNAQYQQALANLQQAKVNLERTEIRSPVNGWVTNLLAQRGDYVNVGQNQVSIVDGDSFWIDGYFEELNIEPIHIGDPAQIKLMGYS